MEAAKSAENKSSGALHALRAAWRWQPSEEPLALALGAGCALLLLLLAFRAFGHPQWGYATAFGCLASAGLHPHLKDYWRGIWPVAIAVPIGAWLSSRGLAGDAAIAVIAFGLAYIGSRSRPWAIASTRALLFMVMSSALFSNGHKHPGFVLLLMGIGSSVTSISCALFCKLLRTPYQRAEEEGPTRKMPWKKLWRHKPAWRFALRVGLGLLVSLWIASLFPDRHLGWIAVTTALLTNRVASKRQGRALERGLGTFLGVLGAALLPAADAGMVMVGLAVLAGARVWLQPRHYLLYSAVMALFVMLIIEQGKTPSLDLLQDRLVATLSGIAITALLTRFLSEPAEPRVRS